MISLHEHRLFRSKFHLPNILRTYLSSGFDYNDHLKANKPIKDI